MSVGAAVRDRRTGVRTGRYGGARSAERVLRALAFGFLPGGVVFGILAAPTLLAQSVHFPAWWNAAALVAMVLPAILLGSLAFVAPVRVIRTTALVAVVGGLVSQATLPFVLDRANEIGGAPWVDQITALPMIAAALAVRPGIAVLAALVGSALSFVDRLVADSGDALLHAAQNGVYVLLFSLTFIALGVTSLSAGRSADAAEDDALAAATAAAVDAARDRERARINALVHDRVLTVLLTAAREIPDAALLERDDARRALDGLEALLRDDVPTPATTGQAVVWQIQAVTTDLVPEATFGYELAGDLLVPGDTMEALSAATEEALRNSLRHAGDANRSVHVRIAEDGVQVDVLDDGVGFSRAQVPPTRLGIAESIEGRMRELVTGRAVVVSEPGVGTRVQLRWRP